MSHIEFVSYTGGFPNLCSGILTLKIDGETVNFGYSYKIDMSKENNYESFWHSGGDCGFGESYADEYVYQGEWVIVEDMLPKKYREYADEISEVFNANVTHGCCGGCL